MSSERAKSSALAAFVVSNPEKRRSNPDVAKKPSVTSGMISFLPSREHSFAMRIAPKERRIKRRIMISPIKRSDNGEKTIVRLLANGVNVDPERSMMPKRRYPVICDPGDCARLPNGQWKTFGIIMSVFVFFTIITDIGHLFTRMGVVPPAGLEPA